MVDFVEMFGRVFVLGGIAATNVAALQAKPQVDPAIAHPHTFFADMRVSICDLDGIEMTAFLCH
ncbi:MAG TPA: hypothetical protein VKB58_14145 [Terriglobales bacterium]|nr:hypothetical protein [Terriglobales bacterium]